MTFTQFSPAILKGAFVAYDPKTKRSRSIVFQLNPDSLQRRIIPFVPNGNSSASREARERISFVLAVDANLGDDLVVQNEGGVSHSVLPFLSAIELLAHPAVETADSRSRSGNMGLSGIFSFIAELFRPNSDRALPIVSLQFGSRHLIPVKLQSINIDEQAFDTELRPVRASVKIVVTTLTERECKRHPYTRDQYKSYMRSKALLADSHEQPG